MRSLDRFLSKSLYAIVIVLVVFAMFANFVIIAQFLFSPLRVVEGNSMNPAISDDDAVFVTSADPSSLEVGDIVIFSDPDAPTQDIMHRIVSIEEESGDTCIVTKGDANDVADPYLIPADKVSGKVSMVLPKAGFVLEFLRTPPGFIICVIIPFALLALYLIGRWHLQKTVSGKGFLGWQIIRDN